MKIIQITAENFKRLKAVEINPDGTLCQITGKNAQGKSSVLDAAQAALGGTKAIPNRPIRDGEKAANVFVDLGDIRVTRRWTSDDRSTLSVTSKEGLKYPSPQKVLDGLVGQLSFDPLAFGRLDAKDQAALLRKLAGLDVSDLDAARKIAYDERTVVGRSYEQARAHLAAIETPVLLTPAEIGGETVVSELAAQHSAAMNAIASKVAAVAKAKEADQFVLKKRELVRMAEERIVELEKRLLEAKVARSKAIEEESAATCSVRDLMNAADAIIVPDAAPIVEAMQRAEETNRGYRARMAEQDRRKGVLILRDKQTDDVRVWNEKYEALTETIDHLDDEKGARLSAAKFPIAGISVDGDVPTFNGLPLAQASSSEQIRIGMAIGIALNPTLQVIFIHDGSLLDSDGLKLVHRLAEEANFQVIMERVGDGDEIGVLIEDGTVAGDFQGVSDPAEKAGIRAEAKKTNAANAKKADSEKAKAAEKAVSQPPSDKKLTLF